MKAIDRLMTALLATLFVTGLQYPAWAGDESDTVFSSNACERNFEILGAAPDYIRAACGMSFIQSHHAEVSVCLFDGVGHRGLAGDPVPRTYADILEATCPELLMRANRSQADGRSSRPRRGPADRTAARGPVKPQVTAPVTHSTPSGR